MDTFFLYAAIYLCLIMLLSLYRAVFGPTVLDRMIGVNAIGSKTTALLIMIGIIYQRVEMFVDIAGLNQAVQQYARDVRKAGTGSKKARKKKK